ncbi:uncharacterized protein [Panulirus ornatus]|uniref:uncharacterized protein isoform X2 n=1 Tax=Panulirus ornatus TaxID=150431 RepID=UPI003A83B6C3
MKGEEGGSVRLDLYNYDQPQNQSCHYILTSPRSLEACRRLNIKPVDLLHQTREEYDAAHPDLPLQERLVAWHSQERHRLKRLREARHLRDRLLVDDERRTRTHGRGSGGGPRTESAPGTSSAPAASPEKEKGESEEAEKKEVKGKEEVREEGSRSSSPASTLARQESENSSSPSHASQSSKEQKDQENIARSLASKHHLSGNGREEEGGSSRGDATVDGGVLQVGNTRSGLEQSQTTAVEGENTGDNWEEEEGDEEKVKPKETEKSVLTPDASRLTSCATYGSSATTHPPPASVVARKLKAGGPRPSSAQRVKHGGHKSVFKPTQRRSTSQDSTTPAGASALFTRIPGEPYRASVATKTIGGRFIPGKAGRPSSARLGARAPPQHRQQPPPTPARHTSQLSFKGSSPGPGEVVVRPHAITRSSQLPRECGTWPGTVRHAATAHPAPPHRPRITWASTPPRHHGSRRSSDSTASLASSLSDGASDAHDASLEPAGTESDDGNRSANSAAECDRQEEEVGRQLTIITGETPLKRLSSSCRLEPRLPIVSVVAAGGTWTPRSDTTTLTPASTPRRPRRRTPTPARKPSRPRTPTRRRLPSHRRVSSARPATTSSPPTATLPHTGSLDEIPRVRSERHTSPGVRAGSSSVEQSRPQSAVSSVVSLCPTYRLSRPSSGIPRTPPMRRPWSSGGAGSPRGGTWSPRLLPSHRSLSTVSIADSQILAKFMDGLVNTEVPARDLRILELLAMKHEKHMAEERRSQEAHRAWLLQKERDQKEAAAQWAEWRSHVNEKRRQENQESLRRWRRTEELYLQSQENLAHLITTKEQRARELLNEQQEARMRRLEERRARESARKSAQEAALRAKEEAEERKRQHLIQLWEQQQQLVDQRRREREEFFRKRVEEGNWAEAEQQAARREQVEARGEALLEAIRKNMEDRLARAEKNLQLLNEVKEDTLRRQRDERERRAMAVQALHHQLEASMMQWRHHVLRRQLDSMAAAEMRQEQYLHTRANRIHADRTCRSQHQQLLLQQVLAREDAELQMAKKNLEAKDMRSQEVARERERQVARARSTALTTATLRENLRKKLAPETFDKVVARANLELRIENRPPATSTMGTRSHIFLG